MILNGYCNKCRNTVSLLADKETKKAHCDRCDAEIVCNSFLITQLIQSNKVRGIKISSGTAYDLYCSQCKVKQTPNLKNNKMYCAKCDYDFSSVNKIIYDNLKTRLKNRDKNIDD